MQPLTILMVEDEPVIAFDLRLELKQLGHQVLTATDAGEAIRLSARHQPDVAILNFLLKNTIEGMALARLLRTRYLIGVLFITGARCCDLETSGHFYPGVEVLYKPFTRAQLKDFLLKLRVEV